MYNDAKCAAIFDEGFMAVLIFLTWLFLGLTFYVYVGYPIIVGLWARLLSKPVERADITPHVSLIIPAYNEEAVISEKIENCLQLDYPSEQLEIIVVVDGSTDNTAAIAQRYTDQGVLVLVAPERRGKSTAINSGAQRATGTILIVSDSNAFYYPDALRKVVRNFNDPQVGGVSGTKVIRTSTGGATEAEGLYWKYEAFIKRAESQSGSTSGVIGAMNAIRKNIFEGIPEAIINDDFYMALMSMRQGYRVLYEPEAVLWGRPSLSIQDDVIRRRRMTAGRYQQMFMLHLWLGTGFANIFRLVSHKFLRLLLPFFMLGALLCNALVMLAPVRPGLLVVTLSVQLLIYGLAAVGYVAEKQGRKAKIPAAAYYIVSSNLASLRGLMRYLRREQTVLWEKARRTA
jgi:poly-beta-1,6-N-acetyl-D-glucosamine synthase